MLCAAPFADELQSGVPTLGAADIRADLDLSYGAAAATVLAVPLLLGLLVESPLLLLAKRMGRRRMATAGFALMSLAALGAAAAVQPWQLALCLAVGGAAAGVALGLCESALMDAAGGQRERWMTRWTIGAALGDLAAPGLLALLAFVGLGWRGALVAAACSTALAAALVARHLPTDGGGEPDERVPVRVAVRRAVSNRPLLLWCAGAVLCDLLDEILVVVAVLFLEEARGADTATAALALAVLPAAGAVALLVTERALSRVRPLRWLAASCVLCALGIVGLLWTSSLPAAVAMLGVIGLTAASMWPIATAQAYRALPEDSTAVAAVENLFAPLGVVLPLAIGAAADGLGLPVAVALLLAQPVGLLLLALRGDGEPGAAARAGEERASGGQ